MAARLRGQSLRGHGDHAGVGIDREAATGIVVQRVSDRIGRRRRRPRKRSCPTVGPETGVLSHAVGRRIIVRDRPTSDSLTSVTLIVIDSVSM